MASDSLTNEISKALGKMTHFVLFWSKDCEDAAWVERELQAAIQQLISKKLPIIIVRLDETPVPTIISDLFKIEGKLMTNQEISEQIIRTVEILSKRNQ